MIGSLRGRLLHRGTGEVLVEVGGVGYRCTVGPATAVTVGDVGDEVFVHVHHHVREDAESLYAFPSVEERLGFEALLGAHGVGPALALAILSVHPPAALRRVLADDDIGALCLVPGVGKKTAARLLVELKSRFDAGDLVGAVRAGEALGAGDDGGGGRVRADLRDALVGLGYGPDEVHDALAEVPVDGDPSALLRQALRHLASEARR
ncbi:MAG: Holliday junction branch migration protein RuvA [Acidimicrobiales bacterium]